MIDDDDIIECYGDDDLRHYTIEFLHYVAAHIAVPVVYRRLLYQSSHHMQAVVSEQQDRHEQCSFRSARVHVDVYQFGHTDSAVRIHRSHKRWQSVCSVAVQCLR